tara:strand:+ start:568 stop:1203 length:636 start_codon:yes stop_codon:yes gene_type:complete
MKKISALLLTLSMIPTAFAFNLESTMGVEILAIDGREVDNRLLVKEEVNDLDAGKHQIVVRYSTKFHDESLLDSRPAVLSIDIQQDTTISVEKFRSHREAKKLIKENVTWKIISKDKEYLIDDADYLRGKGFMPYGNIEALILDYNQENNIVAMVPKTAAPVALSPSNTVNIPAAGNLENTQGNPLISLYQQASMEQKKAFRFWLLEQDMK